MMIETMIETMSLGGNVKLQCFRMHSHGQFSDFGHLRNGDIHAKITVLLDISALCDCAAVADCR